MKSVSTKLDENSLQKLDKIKEITKQETNSETIRFVIENYLSVLNKNEKSDSAKIEKLVEQNKTILRQNEIIVANNEIVNKSIDKVVKAVGDLHNFIIKITTK